MERKGTLLGAGEQEASMWKGRREGKGWGHCWTLGGRGRDAALHVSRSITAAAAQPTSCLGPRPRLRPASISVFVFVLFLVLVRRYILPRSSSSSSLWCRVPHGHRFVISPDSLFDSRPSPALHFLVSPDTRAKDVEAKTMYSVF